jgi:hypothetical protein
MPSPRQGIGRFTRSTSSKRGFSQSAGGRDYYGFSVNALSCADPATSAPGLASALTAGAAAQYTDGDYRDAPTGLQLVLRQHQHGLELRDPLLQLVRPVRVGVAVPVILQCHGTSATHGAHRPQEEHTARGMRGQGRSAAPTEQRTTHDSSVDGGEPIVEVVCNRMELLKRRIPLQVGPDVHLHEAGRTERHPLTCTRPAVLRGTH